MATVLEAPTRPAVRPTPLLNLAAGAVGVGVLVLTTYLFAPLFRTPPQPTDVAPKVTLPAYNVEAWRAVPVQDGRTKPFQTFAEESLRQITGRAKFEKREAIRIVLDWILTAGSAPGPDYTDWRNTPFILCDHHGLRELVYSERLKQTDLAAGDREELLHGKYVSPEDLNGSAEFKRIYQEAEAVREADSEKAMQHMSPEQRKAEEVVGRLVLFERICQGNHGILGMTRRQSDPLHLVQLDLVPGSAWLSLGELREAQDKTENWINLLGRRMTEFPQLYINPERRQQLAAFQDQVQAKKGLEALDALATEVKASHKAIRDGYADRHPEPTADVSAIRELLAELPTKLGDALVAKVRELPRESGLSTTALLATLDEVTARHDRVALDELRSLVSAAQSKVYVRDDPRFRMLHLGYLEFRYPDLYRDAVLWQQFPAEKVKALLASFTNLQAAYAGKGGTFAEASQQFLHDLRTTSERTLAEGLSRAEKPELRDAATKALQSDFATAKPDLDNAAKAAGYDPVAIGYPGVLTIPMELQFARVQPFLWAWVLMLPALLLFIASNAFPRSRLLYAAGFAVYLASLAIQIYGFTCRVTISGRPPVTNMYETVVWVGFMAAVCAAVLELFNRSRLFAIGGSLVATICLVLADQLPLSLDPKISPLVPVLRSQFWLTIHVLTIVSAYAPAALAWGLGNIALGLLAFRTPSRETLKTLSQYTYRGMQIAVLLLAAGTFLGGWWAAYSWGRFWGWDPKETWALIALITYVVPLHARYIGWVKDFGLAVSGVVCFASVVMCWYGVNFVLGAGLHSYGFGGGGPWWVFWGGLVNIEWVLVASILYRRRLGMA